MIKKKAKGKAKKTVRAAKTGKTKTRSPRGKKERNPVAVHNDIAKIVESGAKKITKAVMEQAMAGQLGPAKYLLEMAEIFPETTDGSHATAEEECLAKTLLRRMDLPDEPVMRDEEDLPAAAVAKPAAEAPEVEKKAAIEEQAEVVLA